MRPDTLIVDLDGTLALIGDRSPYDATNCHLDTVNENVRMFMLYWWDALELPIILMSGRQQKDFDPTWRWLTENGIPYSDLFMRETGDQRNDAIVKRELWETKVAPNWNVKLVLDDRQRVVDMWRDLGLPCWQVAPSPD